MSAGATPFDGDRVPRARDVASVLVDGETIIFDAGSLHHLNRTATIVWECCDGDGDLDTLVGELAAVFAIDPDEARADIESAVAELAAMDLLVPPGGRSAARDAASVAETAITVLIDPDEACASCAERPWAHNSAYMIGGIVVPVAFDDADVGQALDTAFAAHLLPSIGPLTPYYAVVVPPTRGPSRRHGLYALQCGTTVAVQSRGLSRVLRSLLAHLASHGELTEQGLVGIPALVIAAGERALLVPRPARPIAFARALARRGLAVADSPVALIDPIAHEVVVGAPGLAVDIDVLDTVSDTHVVYGHEPAPLEWGRYDIVGIAVDEGNPARALLDLAPLAEPISDSTGDTLIDLIRAGPIIDAVDPDAIAAAIGPTALPDLGGTQP